MMQCKYCTRTAVALDSGDGICRKHMDERIRVRGFIVFLSIIIVFCFIMLKVYEYTQKGY